MMHPFSSVRPRMASVARAFVSGTEIVVSYAHELNSIYGT